MKVKISRSLKITAVVFLLLMLFILTLPKWFRLPDRIDAVFTPQVQFRAKDFNSSKVAPSQENLRTAEQEFEQLSTPVFMSNYHWLESGSNTALTFAKYSPRPIGETDGETFQKITITVPILKRGSFKIDGIEARGFFTKGGSAWPTNQCGSEIKDGTLEIKEISEESIDATIAFNLECKNIHQDKAQTISVNESRIFTRLPLDKATPWHGIKGPNMYTETFRMLRWIK